MTDEALKRLVECIAVIDRLEKQFNALRVAVRREREAFAEFESFHNVEPDGTDPNGSAKWRIEFTRLGAEVTAASESVDRLVAGEKE